MEVVVEHAMCSTEPSAREMLDVVPAKPRKFDIDEAKAEFDALLRGMLGHKPQALQKND